MSTNEATRGTHVMPDENIQQGKRYNNNIQTRNQSRSALGEINNNAPSAHPVHNNNGGVQAQSNVRSRALHRAMIAGGAANDGDVDMMDRPASGSDAPPPGVVDIDRETSDDPLAVPEYVSDIFAHYKECEPRKVADPRYMSGQEDINERMRAILIDWLIEVHLKFKLMPETLYLTVNLIDRYLEQNGVVRQKLQLVGVTAMLLASKYEEIYAPEVRDFVYITDRAYTREQILTMETNMLQSFSFNITTPTAYPFLKRFLKAAGTNTRLTQMATYFMERTLQEYRMLQFLPSMVAAAAVNMAMRSLDHGQWNSTLEYYTGYSEEQLFPCIQTMEGIIEHAPNASLKAVFKKWSSTKFGAVARIPLAHILPSGAN